MRITTRLPEISPSGEGVTAIRGGGRFFLLGHPMRTKIPYDDHDGLNHKERLIALALDVADMEFGPLQYTFKGAIVRAFWLSGLTKADFCSSLPNVINRMAAEEEVRNEEDE